MMDDSTMTKNIGTVAWIAPEVLSAKGEYTEKADVYSFGIIVWEAYARKQPFADQQAFRYVQQFQSVLTHPVFLFW